MATEASPERFNVPCGDSRLSRAVQPSPRRCQVIQRKTRWNRLGDVGFPLGIFTLRQGSLQRGGDPGIGARMLATAQGSLQRAGDVCLGSENLTLRPGCRHPAQEVGIAAGMSTPRQGSLNSARDVSIALAQLPAPSIRLRARRSDRLDGSRGCA